MMPRLKIEKKFLTVFVCQCPPVAASVFGQSVVDLLMAPIVLAGRAVAGAFVGHQRGQAIGMLEKQRAKRVGVDIRNVEAASVAVALISVTMQ